MEAAGSEDPTHLELCQIRICFERAKPNHVFHPLLKQRDIVCQGLCILSDWLSVRAAELNQAAIEGLVLILSRMNPLKIPTCWINAGEKKETKNCIMDFQ